MKKADLASAGVIIAFGLFLLLVVIPVWVQRHEEGGYGLGAQVMPNVAATIITALGVILLVSRWLAGRGERQAVPAGDAVSPISRSNGKYLLLMSLFLVAMTALFAWVGFVAAGPLTIAGVMIAMGERRPVHVIVTSVVAAGVIWLFFWQLLNVPLP
jgi:hypothetical protein